MLWVQDLTGTTMGIGAAVGSGDAVGLNGNLRLIQADLGNVIRRSRALLSEEGRAMLPFWRHVASSPRGGAVHKPTFP